jgi:hypothetical protein
MNTKIVRDLELILEIQELRDLGMCNEELEGFLDLYYEEWEFNDVATFNN